VKSVQFVVNMKRPFSVTLLAVAVLSLAAWNAGQAAIAAREISFMQSLGVSVPGGLQIVTGATWAIGFWLAAIGVWRLKGWGRRWLLIAIVAYQLQVWIERLALERASYEVLTRPAAIVVSISSIVIVWFVLFLPKIRRAFHC
jgi:hypothetical protein